MDLLDIFPFIPNLRGEIIIVLVLFLPAGKYDKLAILVHYIDVDKATFLHPGKLHREFLVLIKRVPPV